MRCVGGLSRLLRQWLAWARPGNAIVRANGSSSCWVGSDICIPRPSTLKLGGSKNRLTTKNHQSSNQYPKVNKRHHIQLHHHFEKINSNQTKSNHPQQCPPPTGNSTSWTNSSPAPQDLPVPQPRHHETHLLLAGTQHPDRALTHKHHGVPALSVQQQAHMGSPSSPQRHHQQQQLVENQMTDIFNFAN
jgi:hypothetical protein